MMSPGDYLALRRTAAGLSIDDVAAVVQTLPRLAEIDRAAWLRRIEADVAVITVDVARALIRIFPFSEQVLVRLIELRSYGADFAPAPRICRTCGCSEFDACRIDAGPGAPSGCAWAGPHICTACVPASLKESA